MTVFLLEKRSRQKATDRLGAKLKMFIFPKDDASVVLPSVWWRHLERENSEKKFRIQILLRSKQICCKLLSNEYNLLKIPWKSLNVIILRPTIYFWSHKRTITKTDINRFFKLSSAQCFFVLIVIFRFFSYDNTGW